MLLEENTQAPGFTLSDDRGESISLSQFKGKKVILYFYPRDNTPGCTKEACSFKEEYPIIEEKNAVVIGISKDSLASHTKFRAKYDLPFYLLSDPDHVVMEMYGAWGEKRLYGKVSMGTLRSTFLINEEGIIEKVWKKVNTSSHGIDVQEYL